jgi:hypothetical protein
MASILVLACGLVGFFSGLISLVLGAGLLAALSIWMLAGLAVTLAALAIALRPRPQSRLMRA